MGLRCLSIWCDYDRYVILSLLGQHSTNISIASAFILNSPKDFNNHVDAPLEGDGKEPLTSNKAVTS